MPADRADQIDDYLNVGDPLALIEYIRAMPMGAVVGSTPAFLDPPSLDPPPDADYPGFQDSHKHRRSLVFVGANDGMLHAIDARTGGEVWAFIPFNLLPKLKALRSGQSLDAFKYFVDSSPKISDVKIGGEWRTYLFVGEGAGGTFYNTLDVTLDDIADTVPADSSSTSSLLAYFANANAITWKWSFPRNTSFGASVTTATAPYGELRARASNTEKSIGQTWSDPAIGQVQNEDGPYVMVVGSGFLKYSVQAAYRTGISRAGTTFYVFNVANGEVLASRDIGADAHAETVDDCRAANDCRRIKNALQMDPVATGPQDQRFINRVYIGDLDGKVWKFSLASSGAAVSLSAPTQLYDAGADYPLFSSMAAVTVGSSQYLFVGSGSDLLPSPDAANKPQTSSLLVLLDTGAAATSSNGKGKGKSSSGGSTSGDSQKVFTKAGVRATAPFIVDQHLVFSAGTNIQMFGDPTDFNNAIGQTGVRILSWRTVR